MKNEKVKKFVQTAQDIFEVLEASVRQKPILVVTPSGDEFKIADVVSDSEYVVISVVPANSQSEDDDEA